MSHANVALLLVQRAGQPFAWGVRDCATLAFDVVRALTGRDPAADIRGQWRCPRSALRLLQAQGGWAGLCAARFGPHIPVNQSRDGDVLLLEQGVCAEEMADLGALAVRWGSVAIAQGEKQLVAVPLSHAVSCWRAA